MSTKIPLILIPGLLCDEALWEYPMKKLDAIADCTVTDHHTKYETIDEIADAIADAAPSRFALAGLSMGGYIALEICRKFSDRVSRLALLDTAPGADTPEQTSRRKDFIALCQQGKFDEVVENLFQVFVHPDRQNDPVLRNQVIDMVNRVGAKIFVRQQHAIMSRINQTPHLHEITCPTIVICGHEDQLTPLKLSQEIANHIPDSKLFSISNCGHLSTMERPEEVSAIMQQWLL